MVELILSEAQLACLKAAATIGSEESAALGRGVRIGNKVLSPGPFVVKCPREIANRLLSVAKRSCPDVVPEIRSAIETGPRDRSNLTSKHRCHGGGLIVMQPGHRIPRTTPDECGGRDLGQWRASFIPEFPIVSMADDRQTRYCAPPTGRTVSARRDSPPTEGPRSDPRRKAAIATTGPHGKRTRDR
jgi:hypothetical protein